MRCSITGTYKCRCDNNYNHTHNTSTRDTLRKLFTDNLVYIKMYIIRANSDGATIIYNRIKDNINEFREYIVDYIDETNASNFENLFIDLINKIIGSLNTNITIDTSEFAKFIKTINPEKIEYNYIKQLLDIFCDYILELYQVYHIKKDYGNEIILYDKCYNHILKIADLLANCLSSNISLPNITYYKKYKKYKTKYLKKVEK